MNSDYDHTASTATKQAVAAFREHVSFAKVRFFQQYKMDLVMGHREGPWLWDLEGKKKLFNLHCNGGVFNLEQADWVMERLDMALSLAGVMKAGGQT